MHSQGHALPPALMEGVEQPPGTEHVTFCPNYSAPGISGPLRRMNACLYCSHMSRSWVFAFPVHSIIFLFREFPLKEKALTMASSLGVDLKVSNPVAATGRSVSWGHGECLSVCVGGMGTK